jgi:16S rRNA (cytosine967-C5)-methyltransferase
VVEDFLAKRPDVRLAPIGEAEVPPQMRPNDGMLRILPGIFEEEGGADGFFIARFVRM